MHPAGKTFSELKDIGDHETEGLVIFSIHEQNIIYINKEAHAITGLQINLRVNVIESILPKIIEQDRDYVISKFSQLPNDLFFTDVEFSIEKTNGITIPVCCNAHLISENTCVALFMEDISWSRQHENYLLEFGTKKNTLLDTLAHNVSGALQLMHHLSTEAERSADVVDIKNLKIYLNLLKENNKHCIDIISDLLKKENNETLQISVKASRMDLVAKVKFIYDNLVDTYQDRKFVFTFSSPEIYLNADEFKLLQVVINLVSNAIKFTPAQKEISINLWEEGDEVFCSVVDQGIGIPKKLQPFIFDRKSISGRVGLKGEKSIGIGLSVSKKLIELMKGRMWFESQENVGSTFYFALTKDNLNTNSTT